ncbi:hypothetical protein Tco_1375162, partial [Tanacetum coccineum]
MEDTMLELLEDCRQKALLSMHNDVEDLIESTLNSKLLLIKLNSQHLNKEEQEVKNITEPTAKRQTRITLYHNPTIPTMEPDNSYLLEEFSCELAHIDPIPPGIKKADFDLEEEIHLVENLLYDNSSPRPLEELNLEIADTIIESLYPSPILVEDSDSYMEEIDLFLATNDSMPSGIEDDDYDSEGDICFLEELLNNDSLSLLENESSNLLDHFNDPSPSRPPSKPPDVEFCFDFEPDTGVVTTKVVKGISEHDVLMPNLLPTQPILFPVFDLLLPFSSKNEDKVFNPGILISPLLSHRGKIISNFSKIPMMISGGDIPYLDVCISISILLNQPKIPQDHEDPCLLSILQSSGLRSSAYFRILNPDLIY